MTQKVLKVGSSAAVTIPARSLRELGLKIGDEVHVEVDRHAGSVRIAPAFKVSGELLDWTNAFIEKYRSALKELADK